MANYIKTLETKNRALKAELQTLDDGIAQLVHYITSSKFSCGDPLDGYVSVQDVLSRLADARRRASEMADGYQDIYGK